MNPWNANTRSYVEKIWFYLYTYDSFLSEVYNFFNHLVDRYIDRWEDNDVFQPDYPHCLEGRLGLVNAVWFYLYTYDSFLSEVYNFFNHLVDRCIDRWEDNDVFQPDYPHCLDDRLGLVNAVIQR